VGIYLTGKEFHEGLLGFKQEHKGLGSQHFGVPSYFNFFKGAYFVTNF